MDNYIMNSPSADVITPDQISIENRLDIIDEAIRKKYLARLSEMPIASVGDLPDLEDDMISNVRLYRITEMVYQKGEPVTDKFTTVFNTLSTYNASVFILIDSDGKETNFYIGVRNNEPDESPRKRSTVTLGNTLKQTLIGHFPGVKIEKEDRKTIKTLSDKISAVKNVASVSVVGNNKIRNRLRPGRKSHHSSRKDQLKDQYNGHNGHSRCCCPAKSGNPQRHHIGGISDQEQRDEEVYQEERCKKAFSRIIHTYHHSHIQGNYGLQQTKQCLIDHVRNNIG